VIGSKLASSYFFGSQKIHDTHWYPRLFFVSKNSPWSISFVGSKFASSYFFGYQKIHDTRWYPHIFFLVSKNNLWHLLLPCYTMTITVASSYFFWLPKNSWYSLVSSYIFFGFQKQSMTLTVTLRFSLLSNQRPHLWAKLDALDLQIFDLYNLEFMIYLVPLKTTD
jgi:hypothetical protein